MTGKVELNSTTKIEDQLSSEGTKVLESLSLTMLVAEGYFEAKLYLINPSSKGLVYLKGQVTVLMCQCWLIQEQRTLL